MSESGTRLYFAFGSNMHTPRMSARVPSARFVRVGRLDGFRLAFHQWSPDGSAKCDIDPAETGIVRGVVYRIHAAEQAWLDAVEGPGYYVDTVTVATDGGPLEAFTYRSRRDWLTDLPAYTWYRDVVAAGARAHGLPSAYIAAIEAVEAVIDPETARVEPAG